MRPGRGGDVREETLISSSLVDGGRIRGKEKKKPFQETEEAVARIKADRPEKVSFRDTKTGFLQCGRRRIPFMGSLIFPIPRMPFCPAVPGGYFHSVSSRPGGILEDLHHHRFGCGSGTPCGSPGPRHGGNIRYLVLDCPPSGCRNRRIDPVSRRGVDNMCISLFIIVDQVPPAFVFMNKLAFDPVTFSRRRGYRRCKDGEPKSVKRLPLQSDFLVPSPR